MSKLRRTLLFLALITVFNTVAPGRNDRRLVAAGQRSSEIAAIYPRDAFYRTELYFGFSKPDGSEVSADEWSRFLADEVTPRFPAGFTVIEALGQYQGNDRKIVKEKSRVLILLYQKKDRKRNHPNIEAIRAAYKKAFQQESVMRLDMRNTVTVDF